MAEIIILALMRELLSENGILYIHLDPGVVHYAKTVADEIFGQENFINEIVWKRTTTKNDYIQGAFNWPRIHDVLLYYVKNHEAKPAFFQPFGSYDPDYVKSKYPYEDNGRRFGLWDVTAPGSGTRGHPRYELMGVTRYWRYSEAKMKTLVAEGRIVQPSPGAVPRYKRYLDEMPGVAIGDVFSDISPANFQAIERLGYPTQKPEALLDRVVKASSSEGDLVLDCFIGSGTTAAVAEKLNRRWIACDLSRFAIHTTRKRLLGIPNVKPFAVQNLGKYERQAWQAAEFPTNGRNRLEEQCQREAPYRKFILDLYHAKPITGYPWLHGAKGGRMVHVAAVDAPVTQADVKAIARDAWKAIGSGKDAPTKAGVDILGWDFALDLNETAKQAAAESRVDVSFKKIPRGIARKAVREADDEKSPINAIVSVLMLREGWDVQNVTVVVGLRPYTAKANILPEQTIGRGLRLMFRDLPTSYAERVDIIGNNAFLNFVDDLEKLEELKLDTFDIGKDKLRIVTILPLENKKEFDIGMPLLTPALIRKKSLAEEIAALNVMKFHTIVLPMSEDDPAAKTFRYEGYDIITLKKEVERDYKIPEPQTAQEVIGYYARRIAEAVKLPAQFAALAPKVREFFEHKAFGHQVDLSDSTIIKAMSTPVAHFVSVDVFKKALQALTIEQQTPQLLERARLLSSCQPFPWSRPVWEGHKCVFNLVPCDNDFEREFAKFLDNAPDVVAFAKLPRAFGFTIEYTDTAINLRNYEPDFVAVDKSRQHWLLESKGQEDVDVLRKDVAATRWCENATKLTGTQWKYVKVPQKDFGALQPIRIADLAAFMPAVLSEADR